MNGHPPSGFVSSRLRLWPTNTTGLGYCIVFFKSSSTRNDEEPAERCLSEEDWRVLDAAFAENADPLTGHHTPTQAYEKLFSLIVMRAPAPIGLG